MSNRANIFTAGALTFIAVQSLVQDAVGWRAWIIWELSGWEPAWKTVPCAIFVLLFCWWICASDQRKAKP